MASRQILCRIPCIHWRVLALFLFAGFFIIHAGAADESPYPPSQIITGVTWHWDTYKVAAIGSDLWPVTWGPDDNLYLAWGDGGGFGGTDSDGRAGCGFARLEGGPEYFHCVNINGGKNAEHPAMFPKKGKCSGLLFDQGILYAIINLQDGKWPNVNHVIVWSTNNAASWVKCDWLFSKEPGNFQPGRFLNFGKDGAGVPSDLAGYIYIYGGKRLPGDADGNSLYLARAPLDKLRERESIEFFSGIAAPDQPKWTHDFAAAQPVLADTNGCGPSGIVFDPGLGRFLFTSYHGGPCQLCIFDAAHPWGPWSTVAYYANWGDMGPEGEGLACEFPQKWISADGLTLWAIFSVYGDGGKRGIVAHDRFNLVKVTFTKAEGR